MFATLNKRTSPANKLTQEAIKILNARGNYVVRINNAPTRHRKGTVTKGTPDIVGISKTGKWLGLEIKIGNDKQSDGQKAFEAEVRLREGIYLVIHNLEELYNYINIYYKDI